MAETRGKMTHQQRHIQEAVLAVIRDGVASRASVASVYADALDVLDHADETQWMPINEAITSRWPGELDRIKEYAWRIYDAR